jgi:ABC-2 type transport system permease protein
MIQALRYEWVRISTLRSTWWITAGTVAIAAGLTFLVSMGMRLGAAEQISGSVSEDESREIVEAMTTQFSNFDPMFYLAGYVVAIIGILGWGHEYRHGMIRATLTALPHRWAVWAAKHLVIGVWVAAVIAVTCLLSLLFALLWFSGLDVDLDVSALLAAIGRRMVYTVLLTWLVMSLAVLVRHQTFALVALYLWPLGVENLVKGIVGVLPFFREHYEVTRFLPFNAGGRIMQRIPEGESLLGDPLSAWGGFLVFGLVTAALMGAALALFRTRDA